VDCFTPSHKKKPLQGTGFLLSFPYSVLGDSLLYMKASLLLRSLVTAPNSKRGECNYLHTPRLFPFTLGFLSSQFTNQKFMCISFVADACNCLWKLRKRNEKGVGSDMGTFEYSVIKQQRSGLNLSILRTGFLAQELQPPLIRITMVFNKAGEGTPPTFYFLV
jgi:hypothetical protein